jgi:AraC-like DNA-binding protein
MRPFELADGPGAVLSEFVVSATKRCSALGAAAAERLGEAGLHLIAGTVGETAPGVSDAAADAMRMRILNYLRAHLDDPQLSHARVAAVHRIAPRTLTRLFHDEPVTMAEYIRSWRLQAVRRDLADPRLAHRNIATLAARWCFTDQANFSRAFRARFGVTPSDGRRRIARNST